MIRRRPDHSGGDVVRGLLGALILVGLLMPGHGWAVQNVLDTDSFGGTDTNTLTTYNANWVAQDTVNTQNLTIQGTPGVGAVNNSTYGASYRTGQTWTDDQWAELTIDGTVSSYMFLVGVRVKSDNTWFGYYCGVDNGVDNNYGIFQWSGFGNGNRLATVAQAKAAGDVVNCEVVGTVITLRVNTTSIVTYDTVSDGTKFSTGNPGLAITDISGPRRNGGSWRAGSVSAGSENSGFRRRNVQ